MSLWGGRFTEEADAEFFRFNQSFSFDRRLLEADIQGSLAYAEALEGAGVLTQEEVKLIRSGLIEISRRAREETDFVDSGECEDVHSFVEERLAEAIGSAAFKLHTGRSRNDQVATDLRLFLRIEIDAQLRRLRDLQRAIVSLAEANLDCIMPGYTHLQRAQPILFAHYLLAFYEMFKRDRLRLSEIRSRVNRLPLGAGALAGTGFQIDREQLARRLGFEGLCKNSVDAVSDRDFVIEFIGAGAVIMVHLSRMAEDFILFSTAEFGFIELADRVATGSSLMPQKKNPDSLELIRGKAGRVFGHHAAMLATMKGLPLAYNKDMQEDKEALFDTLETLAGSTRVMEIVLGNVIVDQERTLRAATETYSNATDLADYLVRRGLEFRNAHELVGRLVAHAVKEGKTLKELSLDEYRQFSSLFGSDLFEALSLKLALESRSAFGGTAPERVSEALASARQEVD